MLSDEVKEKYEFNKVQCYLLLVTVLRRLFLYLFPFQQEVWLGTIGAIVLCGPILWLLTLASPFYKENPKPWGGRKGLYSIQNNIMYVFGAFLQQGKLMDVFFLNFYSRWYNIFSCVLCIHQCGHSCSPDWGYVFKIIYQKICKLCSVLITVKWGMRSYKFYFKIIDWWPF